MTHAHTRLATSLLALALLAGCASVPMGTAEQDAEMKRSSAAPDMSRVYIYRNESMGAAIKMEVAIDGKLLGSTAANTYLAADVTPGPHTISSDAENLTLLKINAVPGRSIYVWQEVKMGFGSARSLLHLVPEAEGRSGVNETKLAASVQ